jgi:hypothetical protein
LKAFGIVSRGQKPADDNDAGSSSNSTCKCPTCIHKIPAKYKEVALTSGAQVLKAKRGVDNANDEELEQPRKRKSKRSVVEEGPKTDTDNVSLNKEPNRMKTCVFSQASEDAQDAYANTEASNGLDESGNTSTGDINTADARGVVSDEEWEYAQLDNMATKDAKVSKHVLSLD